MKQMTFKSLKRVLRGPLKRVDSLLHEAFSAHSDPTAYGLFGDRCVEYAFVIEELLAVKRDRAVLDVGCAGSPLTTVVATLGFRLVHGIDLLPPTVRWPNVQFFPGDFLTTTELLPTYDVIVFCSSIEHFGLSGRYGAKRDPEGDVKALDRAHARLSPQGRLVLTIPYGLEKTIFPLHRVYNKNGTLFRTAMERFSVERELYYLRRPGGVWEPCDEQVARVVVPTAERYALGLFSLSRK